MKFKLFLFIFMVLAISCSKDDRTKRLTSFLETFNVDLKNYKIICFVPADGCSVCIDPAVNYSKMGNKSFLLVISSIYTKSIVELIENKNIDRSKIVIDDQNLASSLSLIPLEAPSFYFLKKGRIVKIVDTSGLSDKKSVILEVDKFLSK